MKAADAYLVKTPKGHLVIKGEDTLETMGVPSEQRREVLRIVIRNRGRCDARIESVGQATMRGAIMFADLMHQVPFDISAEDSKTLVVGADRGYSFGDVRLRRFYVEDGAGRKHPLRARWRLRLETIAYRWVLALYWKRRRRQMRRQREPE